MSRILLMVGKNPEDATQRVLANPKNNCSPEKAPSLAYCAEGIEIESEHQPGDMMEVPRVKWRGEVPYVADQLLQAQAPGSGQVGAPKSEERLEIEVWVRELFNDSEALDAEPLRREANARGFLNWRKVRDVMNAEGYRRRGDRYYAPGCVPDENEAA